MFHGSKIKVGIAVSFYLQKGNRESHGKWDSHIIRPQAGVTTVPALFPGSFTNWLLTTFHQGWGRTLERGWRVGGRAPGSGVPACEARPASSFRGEGRSWYSTASLRPSAPGIGAGFLRLLISGLSGFSALPSPM